MPARGVNPLASPLLVPRCSTLILQPCATLNPLLLQPRILGKLWSPEPWQGPSLVKEKSRRPQGGWGLKGHGGGVGSQLPFSHILCFAGSQSFRPGLGFCLLRVAAKTGSGRGSAGSQRIFPGPFWLHLCAPALSCTR